MESSTIFIIFSVIVVTLICGFLVYMFFIQPYVLPMLGYGEKQDFGPGSFDTDCGPRRNRPTEKLAHVTCDPSTKKYFAYKWKNVAPPNKDVKAQYISDTLDIVPESKPVIGYFVRTKGSVASDNGDFQERLYKACIDANVDSLKNPKCVGVAAYEVMSPPSSTSEANITNDQEVIPTKHLQGVLLQSIPPSESLRLINESLPNDIYYTSSNFNDTYRIGISKWERDYDISQQ